jgi:hypothetical protein
MLDLIIMSVERDPASGRWQVIGSDGSTLEGPFASRGAALRWIEDRADPSDVEMRSMLSRASPAQRRQLRAMLDDLDGVGGYGPT